MAIIHPRRAHLDTTLLTLNYESNWPTLKVSGGATQACLATREERAWTENSDTSYRSETRDIEVSKFLLIFAIYIV
jgi:hypothetical protein